jgi:autotransporter translocation and assembly factor TamB
MMRKGFFTLIMVILGLYLGLHLVLGSSPIQRRVVEEIRRVLLEYGFDLQIESIEFSALTPKIYLNRVTLTALPRSGIPMTHPLPIDKIKIEFQPLALISKQIVIEEAVLFHPRLLLPNADVLVNRVSKILGNMKPLKSENKSGFKLVLKRVGVVDALFNIVSKVPAVSARSRSLTAFLHNSVRGQQTVTVKSNNLEVDRQGLNLNLTSVDVDVDLTPKSVRVNRALIQGGDLSLNFRGASALPEKSHWNLSSVSGSYDVRIPLEMLNKIPEIKVPRLEGLFSSSGNVRLQGNAQSGTGSVGFENLGVNGYHLGSGEVNYSLNESQMTLSSLALRIAGGEISSKTLKLDLKDRFPVSGELIVKGFRLEGLLQSLKQPDAGVDLSLDGTIQAKGYLAAPFDVTAQLNSQFRKFYVIDEVKKGLVEDNTILNIPAGGGISGQFNFNEDRVAFQALIKVLQGELHADGSIGLDSKFKIKAKGTGLSLTELKNIADLSVGGKTDLDADLTITGKDVKISGNFEVTGAEIQKVALGNVRGIAFFQNQLLTFENLESATNLDPVRGNGYVDFKPVHTRFKFNAETKRIEVDQAFKFFQKYKLPFPEPKGGEASTKVTIEGGQDGKGVQVASTGQIRNFRWYEEDWASAAFSFTYRSDRTELSRLLLMKKLGGLELKGVFTDASSTLKIQSRGLRIEELDHLGKAPLAGELMGDVRLEGDLSNPHGNGDLRLVKTTFRGTSLQDSNLTLRSGPKKVEVQGSVFGQTLRGNLAKNNEIKDRWDLNLSLQNFDFLPLAAAALGKDIATVNEMVATGEFTLSGDLAEWNSLKGSGTVRSLDLGLTGTPMRNKQPLSIKIDQGALKIDRFSLVGKDSQISMDVLYQPSRMLRTSLDGKMDLQFLQPFIPSLDYGTGKISAGIRVSGSPSDFGLLGNVTLEDGTFRISGLSDEFKATTAQFSLSQDRINVDRFTTQLNGGSVEIEGDLRVNRFKSLIPNLSIKANRVVMRTKNYLATKLSGDFYIKGSEAPYTLGGKCKIIEADLTSFNVEADASDNHPKKTSPIKFDVSCDAKEHLFVSTDVMRSEFKGNLHLLGDTEALGLLGTLESVQGYMVFRNTQFNLTTGSVKFESATKIAPRFSVSGHAFVKEKEARPNSTLGQTVQTREEYEVMLQAFGTPDSFKIRLSSAPALAEADIISLLLLGVTPKGHEGNALDFGSTLMGEIPLPSQIENQLGVDIRLNTQLNRGTVNAGTTGATAASGAVSQATLQAAATGVTAGDVTVPAVQIQKEITKRTKVSYSNTIEAIPIREFKIEHMLDDNLTINGTATDRPGNSSVVSPTTSGSPSSSYGVDFRYRFQFE